MNLRNLSVSIASSGVGLFFCLATYTRAAPQSADMVAHGKSLQMNPTDPIFVTGIGNVYAFFSTYRSDGTFLTDTYQGTTITSGELRPRAGSNSLFEGSYAQATEVAYLERGIYTVAFPQDDSDNDGVIDVLDVSRSGAFVATGSGLSANDGSTFSIQFNVSREANSANGSYTATTVSSSGTLTRTGDLRLYRYTGGFIYDRADNSLKIDVEIDSPQYRRLIGDTSFIVNSSSRITYQPFTVTDQVTGDSRQVQQGQLSRLSGNVYVGDLRLSDGLPETYWEDFTEYRLVVNDPFDHDNDGLPDLTDADAIPNPPSITAQPSAPNTMVQGQVVTLSVTAARANKFQWLYDGVPIAGANDSEYSVTVSPQTSGAYAVRISNVFGNVTSASVTVAESDSDGDGVLDSADAFQLDPTESVDTDGDGIGNNADTDDDGDGVLDTVDAFPLDSSESADTDNDGTGDNADAFPLDPTRSLSRGTIVNVSVRVTLGSGQIVTPGFVVSDAPTKLLIRAVGPRLGDFGVNYLPNPRMKIFDGSQNMVRTIDDWRDDNSELSDLMTASASAGAFPLAQDTASAATLITLDPGAYTVQVDSADEGVGDVLVEVYEISE